MQLKYLLNLADPQQFLDQYWQKQPVIIRNGFVDFIDPLDENELAGLAQEEMVDSRIVVNQGDKWTVQQGPIEDFEQHCIGAWSLLVQGVDQYLTPAEALLNAFNFIPKWRVEDLMVSFSVEGAGVGPHLDQYDVFIVQGKGQRRWQVGPLGDYPCIYPSKDLTQISGFKPIIDEVLHPGDIIYIPPGFPHNGVALSECLNYSVGLRAPTQQELLLGLADFAQEHNLFQQRYTDPDLQVRANQFELSQLEKQRLRNMCQAMLNSSHFDDFLGHFFTSQVDTNESIGKDDEFTPQQIEHLLQCDVQFWPSPDRRVVILKDQNEDSQRHLIWVNQHKIVVSDLQLAQATTMLELEYLDRHHLLKLNEDVFFSQFLSQLVNAGGWFEQQE
ncbi:cupin domain-containing protein [Aliiglaciecola sp. LCG003]|uniref:cupin domain-containing protein n=1 Tax=Aliiglaciecola sp. LCG003 TaxID=3053655 RepID=UPI002573E1AE|nr:cupin domain-containing protein [Aliiglaciecola sp. LCG003]WJG10893.1 cupin domain-containing protein [Aliiglaciecola sp. LCG003]